MKNDNEIMIQPYMMCELRDIYNISEKTFRCWLKKIEPELGERYGRYCSARQVEIIFRNFGIPYKIEKAAANALFF